MEVKDYPSNSFKSKESVPVHNAPNRQVTSSPATVRTKNDGFFNKLVAGDFDSIKQYVVYDLMIPTVKKFGYELLTNTISIFFYGSTNGNNSRSNNRPSYRDYYDNRQYNNGPAYTPGRSYHTQGNDYEMLDYASRADAESVLFALNDQIRETGLVRVSDLYAYAGYSCPNYMYSDYGWTDLRGAYVEDTRFGKFVIRNLPKAMPITQ